DLIQDHASRLGGHRAHGAVQHQATLVEDAAEDVGEGITRVHPYGGGGTGDVVRELGQQLVAALDQGQGLFKAVTGSAHAGTKGQRAEGTKGRVDVDLGGP